MRMQQARCCAAIHEDDTARGYKTACERKGLRLFADGGTDGVAMLNHVDLGRDVEQPVELVAVLAEVRGLHWMKPRRPLEQECAHVAATIYD